MTAHPIRTNPHPMRTDAPVLPMTKDDALFWRLRRERGQQREVRRHD